MKSRLRLTMCRPAGVLLGLLLAGNAQMPAVAAAAPFTHVKYEQEITGTVRDAQGNALPGVTVVIKNTNKGTQTNAGGQYRINANTGDILVFSFVGFTNAEVTVGSNPVIDVTLQGSIRGLSELVVTALGVKKAPKALTYSTQRIGNEELTTAKDPNLMNTLNGKVAGVTINRSSSGAGGSVKVVLRGNKSAQSSNQPLYVIDGIPMTNYSVQQPNSTWGGDGTISYAPGRDGGDGISNLNPDDIESISVLKGASAAALYGSQAANGVILITTKKGRAGASRVDFSSSFTIDRVAMKPEFQNAYGQDPDAATQSWGPAINSAPDNVSDFFRTGQTWINSLSFSGGTEKAQTYFSYANTRARGIIPGNDLNRHNLTFRETGSFLNNKLTLDGSANIIVQNMDNGPVSGLYFNPLTGLYLFPRGQDMRPYKDNFERFDDVRKIPLQNWPFNEDVQQNPYWIVKRNGSESDRIRTLFSASARYEITDWLNIQARGNMDRTNDTYDAYIYAGTQGVLAGPNGRYITNNLTTTQMYGDVIMNMDRSFGDINLHLILGSSITDTRTKGTRADSYNGGLHIANFFALQNMTSGSQFLTEPARHSQLQAVFGNASLSYKELVYLDLTGRNDWSSNLAFTPNGSYFYPSAGLSFILHDLFKLPAPISYAKLRGSYAVVGNSVPNYVTHPVNYLSLGGTISYNTIAPFTDLKPEKTRSLEIGTEWRFMDDRLNMDFTYYKTNTTNQYFQIAVPPGTGYSFRYVNAGDIQNTGLEVMLGYNVIQSKRFRWNTTLNYSQNKNTVKELAPSIDQFILTDPGSNTYASIIKVGGAYGDIYGKVLERDEQGRVLIGPDGTPKVSSDLRFVGNPNPRWQLGWNNSFNIGNLSVNFLVDGKFDARVMSITQAMMDQYGVSRASGDARANGGVAINSVKEDTKEPVSQVDARLWYSTIGGRAGVTGEYMYNASTVRLREAAIGYALPASVLKGGFVKNVKLSLIGRNLIYFYKKAPYDPELTMSTGNGLSGVDVFSLPAVRSFGLNLNVTF